MEDGKDESPTEGGGEGKITSLEKWVIALSGGFLGSIILEVIIILGVTFYRINISLFAEDPKLFVRAINSFGSTFLQGALLGAGGIVAAFRVGPKLISWAREKGYSLGSSPNRPNRRK